MEYTFDKWIESLRPYKRGYTTYLIEAYTNIQYGWIWEFGPIIALDIQGFRGERLRVLKVFNREWQW